MRIGAKKVGKLPADVLVVDRMAQLVAAGQAGAAVEIVVADTFLVSYAAAGIALLIGIVMLCWPAPRPTSETPASQPTEVSVP